MSTETAGARLRRHRKAKGLKQAEFGALVGLSVPQVSRIEKGHRRIKADLLERIVAALGMTMGEFYDEPPLVDDGAAAAS